MRLVTMALWSHNKSSLFKLNKHIMRHHIVFIYSFTHVHAHHVMLLVTFCLKYVVFYQVLMSECHLPKLNVL